MILNMKSSLVLLTWPATDQRVGLSFSLQLCTFVINPNYVLMLPCCSQTREAEMEKNASDWSSCITSSCFCSRHNWDQFCLLLVCNRKVIYSERSLHKENTSRSILRHMSLRKVGGILTVPLSLLILYQLKWLVGGRNGWVSTSVKRSQTVFLPLWTCKKWGNRFRPNCNSHVTELL